MIVEHSFRYHSKISMSTNTPWTATHSFGSQFAALYAGYREVR